MADSTPSRTSHAASTPKTNKDALVAFAVEGQVMHPSAERHGYHVGRDGVLRSLPGVGGIVYSHFVGDKCRGIAGDHIEPGASLGRTATNNDEAEARSAFNIYACVGNTAVVESGDAKGGLGTVIGKHSGVEHVIVHFPEAVLERLGLGDTVRIRAHGAGLALPDHPDITLKNCDPRLLARLGVQETGHALKVPVAHIVPAALMGSGLGADSTNRGDYDIQLSDPATVDELGLADMRFGDLVAITDHHHAHGRAYAKGAVSIGVVVHGDSDVAGHGPGVTTLMTATAGGLEPVRDPDANLADILGLGRASPGDHHDNRFVRRHAERFGTHYDPDERPDRN